MQVPGATASSVYVCVVHALELEDLMSKKCALPSCDKTAAAKGVCQVHYARWHSRSWLDDMIAPLTEEQAVALHARWEQATAEAEAKRIEAAKARAAKPATIRPTHPDVTPPQAPPRRSVPLEEVREPKAPVVKAEVKGHMNRLEARVRELEGELAQLRRYEEDADKARAALNTAVPALPAGMYSLRVQTALEDRKRAMAAEEHWSEVAKVVRDADHRGDNGALLADSDIVDMVCRVLRQFPGLVRERDDAIVRADQASSFCAQAQEALRLAWEAVGWSAESGLSFPVFLRELVSQRDKALAVERIAQDQLQAPRRATQVEEVPIREASYLTVLMAQDEKLASEVIEAIARDMTHRLRAKEPPALAALLTGPCSRIP